MCAPQAARRLGATRIRALGDSNLVVQQASVGNTAVGSGNGRAADKGATSRAQWHGAGPASARFPALANARNRRLPPAQWQCPQHLLSARASLVPPAAMLYLLAACTYGYGYVYCSGLFLALTALPP